MGSTESKVAAQPLAVVSSAAAASGDGAGGAPRIRRSGTGWPSGITKKRNKTAPAAAAPSPSTSAASPPTATKTPRSTPTMEAAKPSKEPSTTTTTTSITSSGPSVQLLAANKSLSLRQLGLEELSTQLLKAVKNGDQRLVERVVELATSKRWAVVNIRGMWDSTPLIYACQYCHEPIALWLLAQGADVHLVNEKGVSALLLASLEGMTAATQLILQRHQQGSDEKSAADESPRLSIDAQVGVVYNSAADVNVRASPLLAASMNGHEAVVRLLLEHGADVNHGVAPLSSGGNKSGDSGGGSRTVFQFPLLVAAKYGHAAVAQLLVEHGADVREMDANENHALLLACEAAKEDCALALLRLPREDRAVWKRANVHGFTPLHFCAVHGLAAAAEFMLRELGWESDAAFVNATSSTRHECAVLMAVRKKQFEVVKLLILCGADATLADRGATTALDVIQRDKRDDLVDLWQKELARRTNASVSTKTEKTEDEPAIVKGKDEVPVVDSDVAEPERAAKSDELAVTPSEEAQPIEEDPAEHNEPITPQEQQQSDPLANEGSGPNRSASEDVDPSDAIEVQNAFVSETTSSSSVLEDERQVNLVPSVPLTNTGLLPVETTEETVEADTSVRETAKETEDVRLPESTIRVEETRTVGDQAKQEAQEVNEVEAQEEEALDLVPLVPRKPVTSRSKSTTGRKAHNRRPTGFATEAKTKAKSLSNLGALAAAPSEENEDEDEENAVSGDANRTESPAQSVPNSNEELSFEPEESFDGPLGCETLDPVVSRASDSPSKKSDRHKKKKRHSKKKHSDAASSPTKESALQATMDEPSADASAPSLCIPESSTSGDLDDDF